jgi:hypothetical protein
VVIPARPYRPKDKSSAELTVLLVCRWILARLRHQRFFSLEELNAAIRPLLTELNERLLQRLPGCRHSVFEALDRPAMRPLPPAPYMYAEWKESTVAFDYHVDVDRHYYSVPHALVGHSVWTRFTATAVEVYFRGERVASHVRSYQHGAHTTLPEHMPKSHRAHAEWSPKRLSSGVSRSARTLARSSITCCDPSRIPSRVFGRAWGEVFGDCVIATAILDRLLHHAITLNIRGNSYRLKEKLKAGLIRTEEPPTAIT